jgi:hypothetical protein
VAPINYPNDGDSYAWENNGWVKLIFWVRFFFNK